MISKNSKPNLITFFVTWGGIALAGISIIARIYVEFAGDHTSASVLLYVPWVIGLAVAAIGVALGRRKGTSTPSRSPRGPEPAAAATRPRRHLPQGEASWPSWSA